MQSPLFDMPAIGPEDTKLRTAVTAMRDYLSSLLEEAAPAPESADHPTPLERAQLAVRRAKEYGLRYESMVLLTQGHPLWTWKNLVSVGSLQTLYKAQRVNLKDADKLSALADIFEAATSDAPA